MKKITTLKDKIFQDFVLMLIPGTIHIFRKECQSYLLENNFKDNEKRIPKEGFLVAMSRTFSSTPAFNDLYELIFERFKSYTCTVKAYHKNEIYRLSDMTSTEEIDIYDISSAFVVFSKTHFKDKMKLLFDLTDLDDDGLINEREIKKMIFTVHLIFCKEDASYESNSKIINQSFAQLQASKVINMIIKYPGELGVIISNIKFIDFDTFYSALEKIDHYKYIIIPFFINFKRCLCEEKKDKSYDIKSTIAEDFYSISNDLIHNHNIIERKNIEKYDDLNHNTKQIKKMKTTLNLMERIKKKANHTKKKDEIKYVSRSCEQVERIDYNKLCNIEVLPAKINIKQVEGDSKKKNISILDKLKLPKLVHNSGSFNSIRSNINTKKTNQLRSYQEIMNEINTTLLCNANEGKDMYEVEKISRKVDKISIAIKKVIKEKEQYSNLKFSSFAFTKSSPNIV